MQKILYIVTQAETGGAQKYVSDLATNLDKNRFEIMVAAGSPRCEASEKLSDWLFVKLHDAGIKLSCLKNLKREINPLFDLLGFFEIYKLIKKFKPDIVHLNSSKAEILGALAAKLAGVKKIIFTAHGYVFNEPMPSWKKLFYKKAERFVSRFINKIICVSEFDRQTGLKNKIAPEDKYVVVHNAINLENYNFLDQREARQKLQDITKLNLKNKTIIGTIANLYKTKGLEYFIEAAKILNRDDLIFLVIGEGAERKNLELMIENKKLSNFFLVGNISNAANYLKAFDIFVLPSVKEGFPYTILEARATNLPIIATRVGALPEIIQDQKNGLLLEPSDPQSLAQNIDRLIDDQKLVNLLKNQPSDNQAFQNFLKKTTQLY